MGGNISLNVLLRNIENQKLYQKAVIESPWLALTNPPAVPLQRLAGFLEKISPKIRVRTGLKVEAISHRNDLVDFSNQRWNISRTSFFAALFTDYGSGAFCTKSGWKFENTNFIILW